LAWFALTSAAVAKASMLDVFILVELSVLSFEL
jgi:hypothetical protein